MGNNESMHIPGWIVRQPLWLKLAAAVACLAGAGLAVLLTAVAAMVHGYLIGHVDQQVRSDAQRLKSGAYSPTHNSLVSTYPDSLLAGGYPGGAQGFEVLDAAGRQAGPVGGAGALELHLRPAWIEAHLGDPVTLPGESGGPGWRVILEPVRYRARHLLFVYGVDNYSVTIGGRAAGLPGTLAVGEGLGGVNRAMGRLITIGVAAAAVLALLLAGLTALAGRAGMRPLTRIGTPSPPDSDGGMPFRFPIPNERSEAGRVMRALNDVLGQADESLAGRAAAQQASDIAARELGQRVAGTAGELRGPLSVIAGFADYYRERSPLEPPEFGRMMKRIGDEATQMAQTVDKLAPGG